MDSSKKALNLLGIATKAGKTASGEFMTEKAVKEGRAFLVLVSEEASVNTKKCLPICVLTIRSPFIFRYERRTGPLHGQRDARICCRTGQRFGESTRETVESEWRRCK